MDPAKVARLQIIGARAWHATHVVLATAVGIGRTPGTTIVEKVAGFLMPEIMRGDADACRRIAAKSLFAFVGSFGVPVPQVPTPPPSRNPSPEVKDVPPPPAQAGNPSVPSDPRPRENAHDMNPAHAPRL